MRKYTIEKEGQIDFFKQFNIDYINNEVLINNTDGVWNGNIFEFKLDINNINKTLFQAIKYLSKLRVKGQSVPANILLISLNDSLCYHYESKDFFVEIHKIYFGGASKNNDSFVPLNNVQPNKLNYSKASDAIKLKNLLKSTKYMPIDIDENCIVGWAERYYRENSSAKKGDFLGDNEGQVKIKGEIREPVFFKNLINPYKKTTNEKFKYLMDALNDNLSKKKLGAYYTPVPYCDKAAELVRMAIARVPKGNDYIILDRCAGTGNLEASLTDEELSHCILSTYEYYEYKVLMERLGDKVRYILPPIESQVAYLNGVITNADALTEEYINSEELQDIVNDPKITIIMLENPPFHDSSSSTYIEDGDKKKRAKTDRKDSYVANEFKKELHLLNEKRGAHRDISNLFIWSAFKYFLRQPTDSYVLLSPVKYFKHIGLVKKKFLGGYAFNRIHFHAKSESVISCILWANEFENANEWTLKAYDIKNTSTNLGVLQSLEDINKTITIKKCVSSVSFYNDKRKFNDDIKTNIVCSANGYEKIGYKYKSEKSPILNKNIVGYMTTIGFSTDENHRNLVRMNYVTGIEQSYGYHLRSDNYLDKLPIFCAKLFPETNWYEKDIYFNSSDRKFDYLNDIELRKSCFIYSCLTQHNKIISFIGSDGNLYTNELCFDDGTLASNDLNTFKLDQVDLFIINLWRNVLFEARKTKEYSKNKKYGLHQINQELNTFYKDEKGNNIYNYKELNSAVEALKSKLKEYYITKIQSKLFDYELLK